MKCAVKKCGNDSSRRGFCDKHYRRFKKYADPFGCAPPRQQKQGPPQKCYVKECHNSAFARRMCRKHYYRWSVHGDPNKVNFIPARPGEPLEFINGLLLEGSGCVFWPFSKNNQGYGQINCPTSAKPNGKILASRLSCTRKNGPPPSKKHQAAHSCGNGHKACVAPWHLSWKTPAENTADAMNIHKTFHIGEMCANAKLSEADVRKIRKLKGKKLQRVIAEQFGVCQTYVSRIQLHKTWRHLSD